jgi:uncharacterized membrane protein
MNKRKIHKLHNDKYSEYFDHSKKNIKEIQNAKNISILPHPATLESYEEIIPGITKQLCILLEKEQKHRHMLEISTVKSIVNLSRLVQFFTFLFAVFLVYAILFTVTHYHNTYLAVLICLCGFGFLFTVNLCALHSVKNLPLKNSHKFSQINKKQQNKR